MTRETEQILGNTLTLRQTLYKVLPKESADYIVKLVAEDSSHRKFVNLSGND